MSAHSTRQYRPVSQLETAGNAALGVAALTRTADNINNWNGWVGNFPMLYAWPANASQVTEIVSAGTGDEEFILYFGRIYLDKFYTKMRVYLQGRNTGAGTANWCVYASTNLYTDDPDSFQGSYLQKDSHLDLSFTSTSWAISTGQLDVQNRSMDGTVMFTLTCQGVESTIISATLMPEIS